MKEINLIKKDTIIPKVKPLDWDVEIKGKPYYVVRLEGFVHTIGGKWGENEFWAYPRDEEPCYDNLIEFNGDSPVLWGIEYKPTNYIKYKWGESRLEQSNKIFITRNGKVFDEIYCNDVSYGMSQANVNIVKFIEHPLDLNTINFDKKMIGMKVWWRSQPAKIESFIWGQACVVLVPDGIDSFDTPPEHKGSPWEYYHEEKKSIKTHILDEHIWWFRN